MIDGFEIDWNIVFMVAGAILFLIFLFIIYLIWRKSRKLEFSKRLEGENSKVMINVFKPIDKITVIDRVDKKEMKIIRKDIDAGETVEINYPRTKTTAKLIIEYGDKKKTYELKVKK